MSCFAKNLIKIMKDNNTSQSELAKVLDVKQQTISRYIKGEREPNINTIIAIAKYFEVTTDYLLGL